MQFDSLAFGRQRQADVIFMCMSKSLMFFLRYINGAWLRLPRRSCEHSAMKTLFLDFDGVLHPSTAVLDVDRLAMSANPLDTIAKHDLMRWAGLLEDALSDCHEQTGKDYVVAVHSSWRKTGWATNSVLRRALGPLGHRFLCVTNARLQRHESILDLCERCGIDDYLIVDDDRSAFAPGTTNLLVTNPLLGLSDPHCLGQIRVWARSVRKDQPLLVSAS